MDRTRDSSHPADGRSLNSGHGGGGSARAIGRDATEQQQRGAASPVGAATATAASTHATTTPRRRDRPQRPDELYVDWDCLINRNESGWPGERSLISHISFPEMDALLGWAIHQQHGPRGGPAHQSQAAARLRRQSSAAPATMPHVQEDEAPGQGDDEERMIPKDENFTRRDSQLLLPSSSVVMPPPSLLELLEEKSHNALDPNLHRRIWDPRAWPRSDERRTGIPTSPVTFTSSELDATTISLSAPVALACLLEEAMVDALLPIAEAYVEHCRRRRPRPSKSSASPDAAPETTTGGSDRERKQGRARRGEDRMELDDDDGSDADEGDDRDDDDDDDDNHSSSSESDEQESDVDVEAWTASPDEALGAMLMDHVVGKGDVNDAEWVQRKERVVAYLARWKGTDVLVKSLRI